MIVYTTCNSITPGAVGTSQTICYNSTPAAFTNTTLPTGGDGTGTYTYQWQSSPDNSTWSNITNATSTTFAPGALTATTYFRRAETSGSCGTVYSNVVTVTVYGNLLAGTVGANQTICYNTIPSALTSSSLPTGGTGSYTYQWQSSPNNSTWTNIANATSTTFAPGALTATTYFRRAETSGSCGTVYSNVVTVTVYGNLVAGTVGANQTICYNTTPIALSTTSSPTGGTGSYTYQWQSSPDNLVWTNINGSTSAAYSPGALTSTTYYKRAETSGACGTVFSNAITITVRPDLVAGSVAASQTICYNSSPAVFTNTSFPTGGTGSYTYQWQQSVNNSTWFNINAATAATYASGPLTSTTYFRRAETSGSCGTVYSNVITITVYPDLVAGTIGSSQTICYNSALTAFVGPSGSTNDMVPTGGTGTYTYQWQSSTNNVAWSDINGATSPTYAAGALTATTYYRLAETSSPCGTVYTNVVTINVLPLLVPGTIGGSQTICYNTIPSGFSSNALPTGGTGSYSYQWQASTDNVSWTDINNANSSTFAPGVLSITTYFRRAETSGNCATVYSNTITVTVYDDLIAGTIGGSQTICYNTAPVSLATVIPVTGGSGSYTYQWQSSSDSITWLDISNETSATYAPPSLISTTYFRRTETSGFCGTVYSNAITITVEPDLVAGSIGSPQTVCYSSTPAVLTSSNQPAGGTGSYTYQWQSSSDSSVWTDINGATLPTYAPGDLVNTTYYRRAETSGTCGTVYSNAVTITVLPNLVAGAVSASQTICYNSSPAGFTSNALPTGGTGSYTYQWQSSPDNTTWTDINGATLATYAEGALIATTYYQRAETSGTCGTVYSNVISVTVDANLVAGSIAADQTICYNAIPASLTSNSLPSGGTGSYTYQWQSSPDNSTWANITGATSAAYAPSSLVSTTYYQRAETSGLCGTVYSNSVTVTVQPELIAGTIGTSQTICSGTGPAAFTSNTLPMGGAASYTYQWQSSPDNSTWTDINSATNTTYTEGTLTASTYYQRAETSGSCGTVYSNVIAISVTQPFVDSVTISSNAPGSICPNTTVTFTAVAINGGNLPSYQWIKNGSVVGLDSAVYTDNNLANGDGIICVLTSNATCISGMMDTSNQIDITVLNVIEPTAQITASANVICARQPVTFTAHVTGQGASPTYQWIINNRYYAGPDDTIFTTSSLSGHDTIALTMNVVPLTVCYQPTFIFSNSVFVIVNPLPEAPSISQTGDVLFSSVNSGNQWYLNGSAIGGATQESYLAQQPGYYQSIITDGNGCSSDSSLRYYFATTSVQDVSDLNMKIYPNPVSDMLFLRSNNNMIGSVEVTNLLGQIIAVNEINGMTYDMDTKNMSAGNYVLVVRTNNGVVKKVFTVTKN